MGAGWVSLHCMLALGFWAAFGQRWGLEQGSRHPGKSRLFPGSQQCACPWGEGGGLARCQCGELVTCFRLAGSQGCMAECPSEEPRLSQLAG